MRPDNLFSKAGSAVLDAPADDYASRSKPEAGPRRAAARIEVPRRSKRGIFADGYPDDYPDDFEVERSRRPGVRLRFNGAVVPKSLLGRIAAALALLILAGAAVVALLLIRTYLLHDEHFVIDSPSSVQLEGNIHVTRAQMLSVFGEDVERTIFAMPLSERRAELERLPWVEHATVMRLLPNRVRVRIVERRPVAFVRQGAKIGLVDAHGVLLEMPGFGDDDAGIRAMERYSFPVITGIAANDPLSTRSARMNLYMCFISALDAGREKVSAKLSEVDLSDPEDVKAVIPDTDSPTAAGGHPLDVLVHFGSDKFLDRYKKYEEHLAEWRGQYPKLASVDMRYERQVVLEMAPGAGVSPNTDAHSDAPSTTPPTTPEAAPPAQQTAPQPSASKATSASSQAPAAKKKALVAKPAVPAKLAHPAGVPNAAQQQPVQHLTTSFAVPSTRTTVKPQGAPQ